ncbi:peptidase S41 [Streptomyces griseocarneus]|nr:peptidase S41 [Streptomyces griseocarneus]
MFAPQRRARRGAALTLVFAGVLATGAAAGAFDADPDDGRTPAYGAPARTAARAVDRNAVDRRAVEAAAEAAAQDGRSGSEAAAEVVSRSGDSWGAVYSAREYEGFALALDGAYVGVGLTTRRTPDGRMEAGSVLPGSPAERAGIASGDRIVSIDGTDVTGRPVTEVVSLLRGDRPRDDRSAGAARSGPNGVGTPVRLVLQRGRRQWERTLRRVRLVTESVEVARTGDGGGPPATLVKVVSFTKGTGERVREAVAGAPHGEGVVLDLRGNSGGLVTEAVTAASAFLDGGLVATYDVHGRQRALRAQRGGDTRRPLVVLVDGGTMSAAELLAGALQDRGRAVVVGSWTFGKGSIQMPSRLPDGSVAELTVGHYRTPAGRRVDGAGIAPDLAVRGDAEQRARTVLGGLGGGS